MDNTKRVLSLNNGQITDESIIAINILYSPDEKGYARQNRDLYKWTTIEFGGDIPVIINGQITNLENDMIELSTYPDNEKFILILGIKVFQRIYQLLEIRPFREPKVSSFMDEIKEIDKKDSIDISSKLDDLKNHNEQSSFEIIVDEDDYDDLDLNFDEDDNKEELDKI